MGKKVLLFAPYGTWAVHHQVDAVLGMALQIRRAEVLVICCDGIFENCPNSGDPSRKENCRNCMNSSKSFWSNFGLPVAQLSSFLTESDFQQCRDWAQTISIEGFSQAAFEGNEIGKWVYAGVRSHFSTGNPDFSKPEVVKINTSFLYNGALLSRAYGRLLKSFYPDHVVCFQGILAHYRVVFELSRQQNIPVLVHERGPVEDSFVFLHNAHLNSADWQIKGWNEWKKVPLNQPKCRFLKQYFENRETGKSTNSLPVYHHLPNSLTTRKKLRVPPEKRIISLFLSNDWERGMAETDFEGAYASQAEGIREIAKIFSNRDDYLVVRLHPKTFGSTYTDSFILEEIIKLSRQLPENVRVVMPKEKLSSYEIAWNAEAAITFGGSMAFESVTRGLAVSSYINNHLCFFNAGVDAYISASDCELAIENAIRKTQEFDIKDLRRIYRCINYMLHNHSFLFKSFGIRNHYSPDIRIKNIGELAEGNDPALDKICNYIMFDKQLLPEPSEEQRQASDKEETEFLQNELEEIRKKRAEVKEYTILNKYYKETKITVVRMRQDGVSRPGETVLAQTIKRSRHKNIEQIEMAAPPSFDETNFLQELEAAANNAKGDYVYIGTDNTHIDESLFSTSVDFLQKPENANYDGIVIGAWICDKKGEITGEIFTERKETESYAEMVGISPSMKTPEQFLSLFVWRKQALHELVSNLMKRDVAYNDISSVIYEMTLSDRTRFNLKKTLIPNIASYMPLTAADLVEKGISLVSEGNCQGASELFDKAKQLSPCIKEIEYCRAMTKMLMGELWQAKIIAESAIEQAGPYDQTEKLLQTLSQKLCDKDLCYEDVALGVETVESALVPGQEKFLFDKVKSLPDGAKILEIGAYKGRSTVSMALACVGTNKRVISIDTFTGMTNGGTKSHGNTFFDIWYSNVIRLGLAKYVTAMPGLSHEKLLQLEQSHKFDFVFIDASHHYVDVLKDLELSYPLVKDGGWMAFHDVEPGWPGPWRLWRESTMQLLSSHQYLSTIACGRKEPGRVFTKPPAQDNFPYSRQWAEYLKTSNPQLSRAMFISLEHGMTSKGHEMLSIAERIIASMPEYLKKYLRGMFNLEAHIDPYLHYWNALTFEHESNIEHAISCLNKAIDNAPLPFHQSLKNRIRKLSESEKTILQTTLGYESMK